MQKNILIVEDHDALRKSLRDWISTAFPGCTSIDSATAEAAIDVCRTMAPDVVLMDISLPKVNGIEATKRILSISPATAVVILTIHEERAYRTDALAAGARAYVTKRRMGTQLVPVLRKILAPVENGSYRGR